MWQFSSNHDLKMNECIKKKKKFENKKGDNLMKNEDDLKIYVNSIQKKI